MGKTAFIIGGTGQIGTASAERLLRAGWEVTLGARGGRELPPALVAAGARSVALDREDTDAVLAAVVGRDVVLDTVAYTPAHADQLVAVAPHVGSITVISTGSVYVGRNGSYLDIASGIDDFPTFPDPLTEDAPTVESDEQTYSPLKAEVERRLLAADVPVSILRPGAIHGRNSAMPREWYFIKRALDRRPHAVLAYDGASVFSTSATANIAELVALCAARPGRRVLNAVDEEALSAAEIGATVFRLLGHDADILAFPGDPTPDDEVGGSPWSVAHPLRLSMAKAKAELGYRQPVTYEDALEDDIRWVIDAVSEAQSRGLGWREAFPVLVSRYGGDSWFPYEAEDAFVSAHPVRVVG